MPLTIFVFKIEHDVIGYFCKSFLEVISIFQMLIFIFNSFTYNRVN